MTTAGLAIPFDRLERALAAWLPSQRWYGAKGRPLRSVSIEQICPFADGHGPTAAQGLILVTHAHFSDDDGGGATESYQVPIGVRPVTDVLDGPRAIAVLDDVLVHEAHGDQKLVCDLVTLVAQDAERPPLSFRSEPSSEPPSGEPSGDELWPPTRPVTSSRALGVEQSNTSVVVDDRYLLKIYRRLHPGTNPDLELQRALQRTPHASARPANPPVHGAVEGELDGARVTYALLQRYLPDTEDGWSAALAQLRTGPSPQAGFTMDAYDMGVATGAVHTSLAAAFGTRALDADGLAAHAALLLARFDEACWAVPALERHAQAVRRAFADVAELPPGVPVQRVHRDLHLGQFLRSGTGWLLTDFEGEPSAPMAERSVMQPAVSDVAGMLRSFDYAAQHAAGEPGARGALGGDVLREWTRRTQDAFCAGYAHTSGTDPRDQAVLLRAHTLSKALYETAYDARNRPHWTHVPLRAVEHLTAPHLSEASPAP